MSALPVSGPPTLGGVARFPTDRVGDARLVAGAAQGDRSAIAAVWERYAPMVRGVLYGALGPDSAIDDLVQDVFVAFVRGAKSISDGKLLRSYLAGVSVRLAALEIRRRKVRRWVRLSPTGELPDAVLAPEDFEGRQALLALCRILDQLPSRQRLAFVLRHVQGLEMLEAAAALRISESTLRRELALVKDKIAIACRHEPSLTEFLAQLKRGDP